MKEYLKPEVIVLDKKNMPAVFLSGDGICFLGYKACSNNYNGTGVCDKRSEERRVGKECRL